MTVIGMNYIEEFNKCYRSLFDEKGNQISDNIDTCKMVVRLASKITSNGSDYGNMITGKMNIENIQRLYNELH